MLKHEALQHALMADIQPELMAVYQALQTAVIADGKTMDDLVAFTSSGMHDANDPTNNTFWSVQFNRRPVHTPGRDPSIENCLELTFYYPPASSFFSMVYIAGQNRFELVASAVYPAWIWSQTVQMATQFAAMTPSDIIDAGGYRVYK